MDPFKRKLRPRAKSTADRGDIVVTWERKRQHSPDLSAQKKKQNTKGGQHCEENPGSAKRLPASSSHAPRSILKKMQSNKENDAQNMPAVVIRNCKLTNSLFDMNKQLMEKNGNILELNVKLCEATIENANLKNELIVKNAEAVIQLQRKLADTEIENMNLKIDLASKEKEIGELKCAIQRFENERFCSDLIQLDDSNEGKIFLDVFRTLYTVQVHTYYIFGSWTWFLDGKRNE